VKILYTAEAVAESAGRNGRARTSDGQLDVELTIPEELGGPGGDGTNPEQLFATGYAACFAGALDKVARGAGQSTEGARVTSRVGIGPDGDGYALEVDLRVNLPEVERETAEQLINEAHGVCPYSKATRDNVEVRLTVD
jgi:Ohr subfamily peroxiredoxin